MNVAHRVGRPVVVALVALVAVGGCGPKPATSQEEYFAAACAAWDALFRAVGNPDTGSGSELSRALDVAVAAADVQAAERVGAQIARELRWGRDQVAIAAGWPPRATVMAHFDRFFAAYEAMVAAKVAAARRDPSAPPPQAAFERAGGVQAWRAMFEAARAAGGGAATDRRCPNIPVTP